jgi:excisionase family DNA binding protein
MVHLDLAHHLQTKNSLHQARQVGNPKHYQLMTEKFLKFKEIQEQFGVSRTTVWRWHAERGLPVVSVGAVTRVRESDLQAFIERHSKTANN